MVTRLLIAVAGDRAEKVPAPEKSPPLVLLAIMLFATETVAPESA